MDLLVIFILILLGIVILLIGLSVGIFFVIKRVTTKKPIRLIALLPILIFSYYTYRSFYPGDGFYKEDFNEVTGVDFPSKGEIIYKYASFPDQFGDYGSVSVIETDAMFYESLHDKIVSKGFIEATDDNASSFRDALKHIGNNEIKMEYSLELEGKVYSVGFLTDGKTIIVNRESW